MTNIHLERLKKYSQENLGLTRGEVRLQEYNPKWKRIFSDEAHLLFDELRIESLRVYHIGSTSVIGLSAKPVLDLLMTVQSLEELDTKKDRFTDIGYEYKGEYGIKGRRYCVLYDSKKKIAFVHLHIFEHDHLEVSRHIVFRDLLRSSSELRLKYEAHKKNLISNEQIKREHYSEAKTEMIHWILGQEESHVKNKKVLIILGAARGHKNTLDFTRNGFIKESEVEIIDLNTIDIIPFNYNEKKDDDFFYVIEKMTKADLVILATPVYWYAVSGIMKDFLDRFSHLMNGEGKILGERLYGKKIQLYSTGYDLKLPLGFDVPINGTSIYFGMDYMGPVYKAVRE
jgi:GrpB-like predicted nucleotidyltransferase (UPF0157 family)